MHSLKPGDFFRVGVRGQPAKSLLASQSAFAFLVRTREGVEKVPERSVSTKGLGLEVSESVAHFRALRASK